jgi:hypothetical protein
MQEKIRICCRWMLVCVLSGLPLSALPASSPSEAPQVVVFDIWNCFEREGITEARAQADVLYFLTSLQGIVNRDAPRLYLLAAQSLFDLESKYRGTPEVKTEPVTDLDRFWLDWLTEKGWIRSESLVQVNTLEDLIARYRGQVKGLVQWDVSVGATLNAALMAAGAEGYLPVSDRLAEGEAPDSVSFLPTLLGHSQPQRIPMVCDNLAGILSIRDGQRKYIEGEFPEGLMQHPFWSTAADKTEAVPALYNLENDPEEKNNLIAEYPEMVKEMQTLLDEYRATGGSRQVD